MGMVPIQTRFTRKLLERLDELVVNGFYSNRSEAIRDATRRHLENINKKKR